ncbi:DUF6933 domain-containing protein [Fulvivirga sediminis]|uniref:DUF6933 domain-containing protein n=1 Tax=Fulvivirga sediminis TaxID=2803949 RepID=A0A937K1Q1_9BACT|nr:hypothetical protein [Fulvivirga sediminis]MBL3658824.1 hypothetical protein [Fulvivirga sediminis]
MANIYCTKKLEKLLGKQLIMSEQLPNDDFGNWNAHLFTLNRRKCVIMVNDVTYYSLIFLDVLKKDLMNFQNLFYQRLTEQLAYDEIVFPEPLVSRISEYCRPNFLATNNNRKVLGTIKEFIYMVKYTFEINCDANFNNVDILHLNHILTTYLVGAIDTKKGEYGRPIEEMKNLLDRVCL